MLRTIGIASKTKVLDLGTGTGQILPELSRRAQGPVVGVDSDIEVLRLAPGMRVAALGLSLPFADATFDLVFAQMFFMWASSLEDVLLEIRRVPVPGGHVLAAAEPDYGGAIESAADHDSIHVYAESLKQEGADIEIGRKLGPAMERAGFRVHCGVHPCDPLEAHDQAAFLYIPYFHFLANLPLDSSK